MLWNVGRRSFDYINLDCTHMSLFRCHESTIVPFCPISCPILLFFFPFVSVRSLEENMQNPLCILQTFNLIDLNSAGDRLHPF